jgi:hypothetical protein
MSAAVHTQDQTLFVLSGGVIIVPFLAPILKPYSTFDTKANADRQRSVNWVLLAICAAVIGVLVRAIVKIS